jgi:hypothetical protein
MDVAVEVLKEIYLFTDKYIIHKRHIVWSVNQKF